MASVSLYSTLLVWFYYRRILFGHTCFGFLTDFIIKRVFLKKKPVLKIYSDWFVKGILFPKCKTDA
jgi:hypothetical protein